jgi:hypothetical protein
VATAAAPTATTRPAATAAAPTVAPGLQAHHVRGLGAHVAAARLLRKSDGPEGSEPLLGPSHERRVQDVQNHAAPAVLWRLEELVHSLDGPGAATARGLLLRAIAARAHTLVHGDHDGALEVLAGFCGQMRGLSTGTLRRRASVLDLDSRTGSGAHDPQALWQTRGTIHDHRARSASAATPDQDGLFQRFTGSCGPTTVQMMLAEHDPVFAFAIHDEGLLSDSTSDKTARFQRVLLEKYGGGKSLGRVESWLRARVHNALGRLVADEVIDPATRRSLDRYLFDGMALDAEARRGLLALRERYGFPSDTEVARMRARPWPRADEGIGTDALVEIVNELYAPTSGTRYEARLFSRGHVFRFLDEVAQVLKSGVDVPFGCSDPGHWMLLSAVKGRKPHRSFLVSDPDGGRTVWVDEKSFRRGTFLIEQLFLAGPGQTPWVDSFLLPVRSATTSNAHA